MPIPPDNRARGDVGHIGDHNDISDELTALAAAVTAETSRAETAEGLAAAKAANLTDLADASAARAALGLGTAATQASSAFDAAGAAAAETARAEAAEAALLPLSSLPLPVADGGTGAGSAPAARTTLGLGTAAVQDVTAFDASGAAAAAQSAAQTFATSAVTAEATRAEAAEALAALKSANLSDLASAPAARTNLGLGTAATQAASAFDGAGTSAAETTRAQAAESAIAANIPTSLPPDGPAGGALTGTYPDPGLATVTIAGGGTGQGTQQAALDALAGAQTSGQYLRGNGTHVQLAAIQAADVPALNQNTTGTSANITGTLDQVPAPVANVSLASRKVTNLANGAAASDAAAFGQIPASLPPNGSASGDLGGSYPSPTVTATHLSAALPVAQGGTGQTTQQAAIDALTGTQSSGKVLRSDGTHATLSSIQAADLPAATTSAQGAVQLDGTASDIAAAGATAAAGSTGKAADAGHVHATDVPWRASDAGFLAWSFDPAACSSSSAPTTGQITLIRVNVRVAVSCTGVAIAIATGGTGLTTGQNWLGLYDSTGTRVGVSADMTTQFASAQLLKAALASGPFALTAGFYWVAFLGNDVSGTIPALQRGNANIWASNTGLAAASMRYATNGTGTTLPSAITPSSNSALALDYWAALY